MIYITRIAKRKGAKKHIMQALESVDLAKDTIWYKYAQEKNSKYLYQVFSGNWQFIGNLENL